MIVQIMKREFAMLYRSRAMRLSTVVVVLLILAAGVLGKFLLGGDDDAPATGGPVVAVEDQMADYVSHVKKVSGGQIDVETIGNGEAENYLRERSESDADGPAVVLAGQPGTPDLVTATDGMTGADQQLSAVVNTAATAWLMEDRGITLSDDDYSTLVSTVSVPVSVVTIGTANLIESDPIGYISSFVGLMILFMMIMMGITTIANGVVEEKSSRVVEIVLTTVRPRTLLLGKILGIGTFLLLQFVLFAIAVVISLNLAGLLSLIHI